MTSGTFYVLLSRPEQLQPDKVTAVLSAFLKVPAFDSRRLAKHCWGFLGERLEEGPARLLITHATQADMGTFLMEENELARMPPPQNVHMGRCADDGFYFTTGSESAEARSPWDRVVLVGALGLREEISVTKTVKEGPSNPERLVGLGITLATGIPVGMGKSKEVQKTVKAAEFYLYMDLVLKTPEGPLRRLHINAQGFNFAYLEGRKEPNVMGNFRLLLRDVVKGAKDAARNKGAQAILSGQPFNAVGYDTQADYEKECRWLLTLNQRR